MPRSLAALGCTALVWDVLVVDAGEAALPPRAVSAVWFTHSILLLAFCRAGLCQPAYVVPFAVQPIAKEQLPEWPAELSESAEARQGGAASSSRAHVTTLRLLTAVLVSGGVWNSVTGAVIANNVAHRVLDKHSVGLAASFQLSVTKWFRTCTTTHSSSRKSSSSHRSRVDRPSSSTPSSRPRCGSNCSPPTSWVWCWADVSAPELLHYRPLLLMWTSGVLPAIDYGPAYPELYALIERDHMMHATRRPFSIGASTYLNYPHVLSSLRTLHSQFAERALVASLFKNRRAIQEVGAHLGDLVVQRLVAQTAAASLREVSGTRTAHRSVGDSASFVTRYLIDEE
jgi:hypothetical protein